jgi:hypothetical protein
MNYSNKQTEWIRRNPKAVIAITIGAILVLFGGLGFVVCLIAAYFAH